MPAEPNAEEFRWTLQNEPGPDWAELVRRFEGGFFHSPPALHIAVPVGEALYARLEGGRGPLGIAVGVRTRCRMGVSHVQFTTLPATAGEIDRVRALRSLVRLFREDHSADVRLYSYGAPRVTTAADGGRPTRERLEFVVDLERDADKIMAAFARSHRSRIRKGIRAGWTLRSLRGRKAAHALFAVQARAAARQMKRGSGYDVSRIDNDVIEALTDRSEPFGLEVLGAYDGKQLLAAQLIGWAGCQGYSVKGGSTDEGYRASAAHWLQWQVMQALKSSGYSAYNLGGVPKGAVEETHRQHGLYEYKTAFGAEVLTCTGLHFALRPFHLRLHSVLGFLRS